MYPSLRLWDKNKLICTTRVEFFLPSILEGSEKWFWGLSLWSIGLALKMSSNHVGKSYWSSGVIWLTLVLSIMLLPFCSDSLFLHRFNFLSVLFCSSHLFSYLLGHVRMSLVCVLAKSILTLPIFCCFYWKQLYVYWKRCLLEICGCKDIHSSSFPNFVSFISNSFFFLDCFSK